MRTSNGEVLSTGRFIIVEFDESDTVTAFYSSDVFVPIER